MKILFFFLGRKLHTYHKEYSEKGLSFLLCLNSLHFSLTTLSESRHTFGSLPSSANLCSFARVAALCQLVAESKDH